MKDYRNTSGLGTNIDFKKRGRSISKSLTGLKRPDSYKKKRSELMKKKWADPEYRKSQKAAQKGKKPWNKGKSVIIPQKQREKMITNIPRGKDHYNWQGGITPEKKQIRASLKYKTWRTACFERDDYTCRGCGKKGCYLEVHHIKSFADYPDLRFVVDNGITYCKKCHAKVDAHRAKFLKGEL